MKKKKNTLTTIADLHLNDVFAVDPDSEKRWRIISVQVYVKSQHLYGALAALIEGGKFKTKAFRKNQQVVYISKMIVV